MFRRMGQRISDGIRRFMFGRYGLDQLNVFLMIAAVALCLLSFVFSRISAVWSVALSFLLNLIAYVLLFGYVFRAFSRNIEKRNRENRRFLTFKARLTDRRSRYYRCPNCKQTVRVPRGRGKICIKCPKCGEKFVRKS